jgi:protein involved in temperature-dependent protein secretion
VFVEETELAGIANAIEHKYRSHMTAELEARARLSGHPVPVIGDRNKDSDVAALIQALAHWRDRTGTEA